MSTKPETDIEQRRDEYKKAVEVFNDADFEARVLEMQHRTLGYKATEARKYADELKPAIGCAFFDLAKLEGWRS